MYMKGQMEFVVAKGNNILPDPIVESTTESMLEVLSLQPVMALQKGGPGGRKVREATI